MKILFVCLGNIIRSPLAEEILRQLISQDPLLPTVEIESCGLGDWHTGQLPDKRMRGVAKEHGLVLKSRAQPFDPSFFDRFDLIFCADIAVLNDLRGRTESRAYLKKLHLMTDFSEKFKGKPVPDPYYCDRVTFERVYDMIDECCRGIAIYLRKK